MLSGESNENGEKTTMGVISKKATLHVHWQSLTLFLYISLPLCCTTTTWNFQKLPGYTFCGGNVVRVLATFFFTAAPWWPDSISHFLTAATKISCCSSNKKMSPLLFSLLLALCRSFSRWSSLVCRPLSLFLCVSLSLYSIYVDMTINISLIL